MAASTSGSTCRTSVRYTTLWGSTHRLVLITCGGAFDERAGHYTDNIVVVAEPVTEDDT